MADEIYDALVVGAGPTGLLASLALHQRGFSCCLIGKAAERAPGRTTAILESSLALIRAMDLGEAVEPLGEPLRAMRLIDDTGAILRSPEVTFWAAEMGIEAFGRNIPNDELTSQLEETLKQRGIARFTSAAQAVTLSASHAHAVLEDGTELAGKIVVGADGRQSLTRTAAGIGVQKWHLPQTALVLTFEHEKAHDGVSTEFHRKAGPFTQVPLAEKASSLVWVTTPSHADELTALKTDKLAGLIEAGLHRTLGSVRVTSQPSTYPLSTQVAKAFAKNRVILVGEAAHAFAPIGAQGLNLGFRDVADMAQVLARAQGQGKDIGGDAVLTRLNKSRAIDIWPRTLGVEALNRSLFSSLPFLSVARCAVLSAAQNISPFRKALMAEGLAGRKR